MAVGILSWDFTCSSNLYVYMILGSANHAKSGRGMVSNEALERCLEFLDFWGTNRSEAWRWQLVMAVGFGATAMVTGVKVCRGARSAATTAAPHAARYKDVAANMF